MDKPEQVVSNYNKSAMESLKKGQYERALDSLQRAKSYLSGHPMDDKHWAITFNNLGCVYKRLEDFSTALSYFRRSLRRSANNPRELSGANLNICAVMSILGKHSVAVKYAHKALSLAKETPNCEKTVALAYYNIGTELKHMGQSEDSVSYLKTGWNYALKNLGNCPITEMLRKSFSEKTPLKLRFKARPVSGRLGSPERFRRKKNGFPAVNCIKYVQLTYARSNSRKRCANSERRLVYKEPPSSIFQPRRSVLRFQKNSRAFQSTDMRIGETAHEEEDLINAVIAIQAIVRQRIARDQCEYIKNSVLLVQRNVKMHQTRKLFSDIKEAAQVIQRKVREYLKLKKSV